VKSSLLSLLIYDLVAFFGNLIHAYMGFPWRTHILQPPASRRNNAKGRAGTALIFRFAFLPFRLPKIFRIAFGETALPRNKV